jgi:hypothetical protein
MRRDKLLIYYKQSHIYRYRSGSNMPLHFSAKTALCDQKSIRCYTIRVSSPMGIHNPLWICTKPTSEQNSWLVKQLPVLSYFSGRLYWNWGTQASNSRRKCLPFSSHWYCTATIAEGVRVSYFQIVKSVHKALDSTNLHMKIRIYISSFWHRTALNNILVVMFWTE